MNEHLTLRRFPGYADIQDKEKYEFQTVVDNVCLLADFGQLVVKRLFHQVCSTRRACPSYGYRQVLSALVLRTEGMDGLHDEA